MKLSDVLTLLQLIPAIVMAIKGLEDALPESGNGAVKLGMLRQIMETTNSAVMVLWPAIERTVAIIVAGINSVKNPPAAK
jgi:hypothetical protein